jgi:hypothetical protein
LMLKSNGMAADVDELPLSFMTWSKSDHHNSPFLIYISYSTLTILPYFIDEHQVDTWAPSPPLKISTKYIKSIPGTRHSCLQSTGLIFSITCLNASKVHKLSSPSRCFPAGLHAIINPTKNSAYQATLVLYGYTAS